MESKTIIFLLVACIDCQAHASVYSTFPGKNITVVNNSTSICTQEGFVANPNANNCRTYIKCRRLNGTLVESVQVCSNNTLFDPSSGFCSFNYSCNGSNSTLPGNNGTDGNNSTSICTQQGFIANPNTNDCKTYIQCKRLNGTLVESVQVCSNNTFFDPDSGFCSFNYSCNGSNSTLPENNGTDDNNSTSICTQEGFVANPNANDCRTYIKCQRLNGTLVESIQVCSNNTFFDPSSGFCSFNYSCNGSNSTLPGNNGTDGNNSTSICTQEGFVANPNANDCKTYIQCKRLNGTLVESVQVCSNNTFFDPNSGFCSFNYSCNGSNSTLPENNGTDDNNSTSICNQEGFVANPNANDCRTYIKCQRLNGTLVESIQVCSNNTLFDPSSGFCSFNYSCNGSNSTLPENNGTDDNNSTSICTKEGFVANPNANDCKTYIQCKRLNGTLVESVQVCSNNTFFDPNSGFCSFNYSCNGSNSTLPENNGTDDNNSTSICTQEGFVANPNANDCRTYIKCQRMNGTLVESIQVCSNNTLFDPSSGFCSFNYSCNGSNSTLPENNGTDGNNSTSICTQEGFVANPNANDCKTYIQCKRLNGTLVESVQVCSNNTFFDPSSGFCSFNYSCNGSNSTFPENNGTDDNNSTSICTKEGFVANPNANDCKTYIQCKRLNGTLVESVQVCSNNTFFDPSSGFCSFNYSCNGSNSTLPENNGTDGNNSTSICTQEGFVANPNANDCKTYIQCKRLNGTLVESIQVCLNNTFFDPSSGFCSFNYSCNGSNSTLPENNGTDDNNSTSICTKEGFVANPNANDCKTYIQCKRLNGTLVESVQVCSNNTFFDPSSGFCSFNYSCNGSNSTLPKNNGTDDNNSTSICTKEGFVANPNANDCKTYIQCKRLNGTLVESVQVCSNNTFFDPSSGFCSFNYSCNGSNSTLPENNGTDGNNSTSICTQEGFVANPNANDCKTYIQCKRLNGTLVESIQVCLNNTFFDPSSGFCSFNYSCNGSNSTLPENNGTDDNNSTLICTKEGFVANPNANDCKTYIQCKRLNGTLVESVQVCSNNTFFDPSSGFCSFNYSCNGSNSTLPENNGTDDNNSTSICTKEGFVANPNANDCKTYIQCKRLNGTLVESVQVCSNNTFFDPSSGFCSFNYSCNGSNSTLPENNGTDGNNSTSICTQEGFVANPNANDCKTYIQCKRLNGTLVESIQVCLNNTFFDPSSGFCSFNYSCNGSNSTLPENNGTDDNNSTSICTKEGFVANPNANDCKTYIQCKRLNGTLVESVQVCSNNTFFDPNRGFCSFNYSCNGFNSTLPENNGTDDNNSTSNCTQEGFVANPNANDCRTYIKCQRLNGTLVQSVQVCPNNTLFDPSSGFCSFNYSCNGSNSTLPGNNGTVGNNSTLICTQEGFAVNSNANDCRTYIKCQRLNGTLVESVQVCSNNTFFDPSSGFCSFNYSCNGSNRTVPGNNSLLIL